LELECFEKNADDAGETALGVADELLENFVGDGHEFFHVAEALAGELDGFLIGGGLADVAGIQHGLALLDGFQDGVHLAALALGGDDGKDFPDVVQGFEELAALTALVEAADDAPVA